MVEETRDGSSYDVRRITEAEAEQVLAEPAQVSLTRGFPQSGCWASGRPWARLKPVVRGTKGGVRRAKEAGETA